MLVAATQVPTTALGPVVRAREAASQAAWRRPMGVVRVESLRLAGLAGLAVERPPLVRQSWPVGLLLRVRVTMAVTPLVIAVVVAAVARPQPDKTARTGPLPLPAQVEQVVRDSLRPYRDQA